jgi:hypothetical protein
MGKNANMVTKFSFHLYSPSDLTLHMVDNVKSFFEIQESNISGIIVNVFWQLNVILYDKA